MYTADFFISKLQLEKHIEGGYFKEYYRSNISITDKNMPIKFDDNRQLSTLIYFLLKSGQVSKFHKLKFDEVWLFHYGSPLIIHTIDESGSYQAMYLGLNIEQGELPQVLIKSNVVFGAEPLKENTFSLVSCMVSPGFDFRDFTLYQTDALCKKFPEHTKIISRLNN